MVILVSAESSFSNNEPGTFEPDLSGQDLLDLYNSTVYKAEWMEGPFGSGSSFVFPLSHSGVRVTLGDGSQWLVHKGRNYGVSSDTVVTRAGSMSSHWRTLVEKEFNGRKTVGDFVRKGGKSYNLLFNCHVASLRMMLQ